MVASQLADLKSIATDSLTDLNGDHVSIATYLHTSYGYRHDFVGYCGLVLIGFILLFHIVTVGAHIKINFQTR